MDPLTFSLFNGFLCCGFIVTWVALSTARHHHAFTSSVGALVEVCLAFRCKDCESVFIVFTRWNHQEVSRNPKAHNIARHSYRNHPDQSHRYLDCPGTSAEGLPSRQNLLSPKKKHQNKKNRTC